MAFALIWPVHCFGSTVNSIVKADGCKWYNRDPVLSGVKLIAEPWDLGHSGYQLGMYPPPWREWNDKYRDVVRRYWSGEPGITGQFATRIAGSSDLFAPGHRRPSSSINYVTSHDGFTLQDLVSL